MRKYGLCGELRVIVSELETGIYLTVVYRERGRHCPILENTLDDGMSAMERNLYGRTRCVVFCCLEDGTKEVFGSRVLHVFDQVQTGDVNLGAMRIERVEEQRERK